MKKTAIALTMALALGAGSAMAAGPSAKDAADAITAAVKANNTVSGMGFEWRDTYKKLLGPAKKAYQKGDYAKAIELANTAKAHAELGMEQASRANGADLIM